MAIPLTKTKSAIPDEEMADFVYVRNLVRNDDLDAGVLDFSRRVSGMPESVMIMSMSSSMPILPKPRLPNLEESASTTVCEAADIMALVSLASSMVAQVMPEARSMPSQPI